MDPRPAALRRRTNNRALNRMEIDEVATDLIVRYGAIMMKDALRFSRCQADAEDAYQRALEILVRKSPAIEDDHLVPWIRTVVRNEALAIAQSSRNRLVVSLESTPDTFEAAQSSEPSPEEHAELVADLEAGGEALRRLKEDQVRCLVAQASGLSYGEISEATGFSNRKVTRCVCEGRKAFLQKVDAIQEGSECERVEPLLHALIDGDAAAAIEVRPHLSNCRACQSRLRRYRQVQSEISAFFPPAVVVLGLAPGQIEQQIAQLLAWSNERLAVGSLKYQQWAELGTAKKLGVIGAMSAALLGGGAVVEKAVTYGNDGQKVATPATTNPKAVVGSGRIIDARKKRSVKKRRRRSASSGDSRTPKSVSSPRRTSTVPPPAKPVPITPIDDGSAEFLPDGR